MEQMGQATWFSFRAECIADVDRLQAQFAHEGVEIKSLRVVPDAEGFPDVEVEGETTASFEAVRASIQCVVDGHVMIQTLRACRLAQNSLERDYDAPTA